MSLLLPQTRTATVVSVSLVDIHGDRYVDVSLTLEGTEEAVAGRVSATECPADLKGGERVNVKLTMGIITGVTRAG